MSNRCLFFLIGTFALWVLLHHSIQGLIHLHQLEGKEMGGKCGTCKCIAKSAPPPRPGDTVSCAMGCPAPSDVDVPVQVLRDHTSDCNPLLQLPHIFPPTPQKEEVPIQPCLRVDHLVSCCINTVTLWCSWFPTQTFAVVNVPYIQQVYWHKACKCRSSKQAEQTQM
jgi:hypothetical protein